MWLPNTIAYKIWLQSGQLGDCFLLDFIYNKIEFHYIFSLIVQGYIVPLCFYLVIINNFLESEGTKHVGILFNSHVYS